MNQVSNRSEKSSTFFGGSNFMKLNNYLKTILIYEVLTLTVPLLSYPLRNGDFSMQAQPGVIADWKTAIQSGKYKFKTSGNKIQNPASEAIIESVIAGKACYFQDMLIMKGTYLLEVEVKASKNSTASVVVGDKNITVSGADKWEQLSLEFSAEKSIRIHLFSLGRGTVRFKNARLTIKKLKSSPVKFTDGTILGAIKLTDNASESEKYAVYELQKYIWKMTGKVIGLEGRDITYPGRKLLLGKGAASAELKNKLKDLSADSYLISQVSNDIILAGNAPTGTLYAAYDFLKLQGCGWYMPGEVGEVVPVKEKLIIPDGECLESPDYDVRGFYIQAVQFLPNGGWEYAKIDDELDWAVRNRMNAAWFNRTIFSFKAYRGHGHKQTLNHAWNKFLLDDHPEWWVLHKGKRIKRHPSNLPNQLCVSNKELRNYVVKTIIEYFKENPTAKIYALSSNDEPCYWCECDHCRALDSDKGKGKWTLKGNNVPVINMTDRTVNFVNEIAERVSRVYPDKQIEMYAYASVRQPPLREKVHPNVLIKYTFWPKSPLNHPLLDASIKNNKEVIKQLDGWSKTGVKVFGLYDYGNWIAGDAPILRFFQAADSLKTFHDRWGFKHELPESANNFQVSFMMYNLRARLLWDVNTNYKTVIRDICKQFYGPAAKSMIDYYMLLDKVLMKSKAWKAPDWHPNDMREYDIGTLKKGWKLLKLAESQCQGQPVLEKRVGIALFGHAYMAIFIAGRTENNLSSDDKEFVLNLHKTANVLCRKYNITFLSTAVAPLSVMYFKPEVKSVLYKLPIKWKFKIDKQDVGLRRKWYKNTDYTKWDSIRTDQSWIKQGHKLGIGWYKITFNIPKNIQEKIKNNKITPALYFGAIDGTADIFLNGEKIGEQKQSVGFMWDKPFAIVLPKDFNPAIQNKLVIRVKKNSFNAGIWKPVNIIESWTKSLNSAKVSSIELHNSRNAVITTPKDIKTIKGWKILLPQYIQKFKPIKKKNLSRNNNYQFYFKGSNGGTIYYKFPTAIGKTYKITYKIKTVSGLSYIIAFTDDSKDPLSSKIEMTDSRNSKPLYFTAKGYISYLGFRITARPGENVEVYVDDISIRELK